MGAERQGRGIPDHDRRTGSIVYPLVETVGPDTRLDVAVDRMRRAGLPLFPVTGPRGELVGVLRQWEIIRYWTNARRGAREDPPSGPAGLAKAVSHTGSPRLPGSGFSQPTVAEVMADLPIRVDSDASVWEAKRLMDEWGVSCVPVTSGGIVMGVVTSALVLRAVLQARGPEGTDGPVDPA